MKLTILGTGNATVSECYNTCYAISDEGKHFLVDAGGGNRILKVLKDTGIDMNDIHDIFDFHEGQLHVHLCKFGLSVRTQILVTEAFRNLIISVHTGNHQKLLIQLWGLRQTIEIAGVYAAR